MRSSETTYNDVVHIIFLDLGCQVDVDFNSVLGVLFLNGGQERMEPFSAAEVTDDPGEVDLGKPGGLRIVEVVHAVPDGLQDGREGRNADTSADEENCLIVQKVLTGTAERSVNHDTREDTIDGVGSCVHDLARFLAIFLLVEVTATGSCEGIGEISDHANVN